MPLVGRAEFLPIAVRRLFLVLLWLVGISTGGLIAITAHMEPMQDWQSNALRILVLDVCAILVTWSLAATLSLLNKKRR